ncbi:hypothetical protein VTK56DRAFT_1809 [Thermocarpiscus australiensis]
MSARKSSVPFRLHLILAGCCSVRREQHPEIEDYPIARSTSEPQAPGVLERGSAFSPKTRTPSRAFKLPGSRGPRSTDHNSSETCGSGPVPRFWHTQQAAVAGLLRTISCIYCGMRQRRIRDGGDELFRSLAPAILPFFATKFVRLCPQCSINPSHEQLQLHRRAQLQKSRQSPYGEVRERKSLFPLLA